MFLDATETARADNTVETHGQVQGGNASGDGTSRARDVDRRRRRIRLLAIVVGLLALGIQVDVARSVSTADELRDEASAVRAEGDVIATDVADERVTLTRSTDEARAAAEALAIALTNLAPGASPESNEVDVVAARVELATAEEAVVQLTAAAEFDAVERDRLVSCLTYAEQALGIAQTNPPNSSSLYSLATVACRDAGTGAFTNVGRP